MPQGFRTKILTRSALPGWREGLSSRGLRLVVTNGCFDILHAGHAQYLEAARNAGDALLVGLNSDRSVRELKGTGRPVNPEEDRAAVLAALESVSGVCVFDELRATAFLAEARPDIYVKGGDYTVETIPQDERRVVESNGGRIIFLPFLPGRSTTRLLKKLSS
ncbi:MAG: adenylyltransferase/cytidyltransferase family protein [Verrucomicrobia bacterium]|nr:adenylyltransferase/cytidyltransferase family protein [Verrucomicrobiota bacterium]